jgi:hypothetical protein
MLASRLTLAAGDLANRAEIEAAAAEEAAARDAANRAGRRLTRLEDLDDDDPMLAGAKAERRAAMARLRAAEEAHTKAKTRTARDRAQAQALTELMRGLMAGDEDSRIRFRALLGENIKGRLDRDCLVIAVPTSHQVIGIDESGLVGIATADLALVSIDRRSGVVDVSYGKAFDTISA